LAGFAVKLVGFGTAKGEDGVKNFGRAARLWAPAMTSRGADMRAILAPGWVKRKRSVAVVPGETRKAGRAQKLSFRSFRLTAARFP